MHIYYLLLSSILYLDGGFDLAQASYGKLADFNIWRREMSVDQLNSETCGFSGDVVSWRTLQEKGTSARTKHVFPGCNGVYVPTTEVI